MMNEEAHIHVDVQSEFYLFRPLIGRQLKGVVTKKSPTHVSCLVHGVFNVPCHRPHDMAKNWFGAKAQIQQVVHLTVLKTDMSQRVPFILGDLKNIGLDNQVKTDFPEPPVLEYSEDEWTEITENKANGSAEKEMDEMKESLISNLLNESSSKKSKKKKKDKADKPEMATEEVLNSSILSERSETDEKKKRRSKKLYTLTETILDEVTSSPTKPTASPKKEVKSPKKEVKSPKKEVKSPQKEVKEPTSPKKEVKASKKRKTSESSTVVEETPAKKKSKKNVSFETSTPILENNNAEVEEKKKKKKDKKSKKSDLSSVQDALIASMLKNLKK